MYNITQSQTLPNVYLQRKYYTCSYRRSTVICLDWFPVCTDSWKYVCLPLASKANLITPCRRKNDGSLYVNQRTWFSKKKYCYVHVFRVVVFLHIRISRYLYMIFPIVKRFSATEDCGRFSIPARSELLLLLFFPEVISLVTVSVVVPYGVYGSE